MYRRILVAYDDSPSARIALDQALDLAQAERVESLTLLAVVPPVSSLVYAAGVDAAQLSAAAREETDASLRAARDRVPTDVPLRTITADGPAGEAIVHHAREHDADLIVMGSRGRGPLGAALLGSVSTHVLHHTDRAVLVAHAPRPQASSTSTEQNAHALA